MAKSKSKNRVKGVEEPVETKDIFDFLYPHGFLDNPDYVDKQKKKNNNDNDDNDDDDDDVSSLTASKSKRDLSVKPFFVTCSCGKPTFTTKKTAYGNAIDHPLRKCYDVQEVKTEIIAMREQHAKGLGGKWKQGNVGAMLKNGNAKPGDIALYHWMKLVTLHNVPITKLTNEDFVSMLSYSEKSPCYKTFIDTMFELSLIVEQKIAKEMKGKKGIIMHDGWSKFARHYVCLLACYLIGSGKRDSDGTEIMEPVTSLLTCTTLPHDDAGNGEGKILYDLCF